MAERTHLLGRTGVECVIIKQSMAGMVSRPGGELDGAIAHAVATHHREPKPDRHDSLAEAIYLIERVDLLRQVGQTPNLVDCGVRGR